MFEAEAVVLTAVFRRITPLLPMLQRLPASRLPQRCWPSLTSVDWTRPRYARAAAATGQLAVSEDECQDVLWATLDGSQWHRLVAERGWSDERFAAWLGKLWTSAMVRI